MKHKNQTNFGSSARAVWLAEYEEIVVTAKPELRGKIDWMTAIHLYNSGVTPLGAATKFLTPKGYEEDKTYAEPEGLKVHLSYKEKERDQWTPDDVAEAIRDGYYL